MQSLQERIKEIETSILANRIMIGYLAKNYIKNEEQLLKWMDECDKKAEELMKKSIDKKKK